MDVVLLNVLGVLDEIERRWVAFQVDDRLIEFVFIRKTI